MSVSMEQFLKLTHRVEKLEQKQQEAEDKEIKWAMSQFDYKGDMTSDERKAWRIIRRRLLGD